MTTVEIMKYPLVSIIIAVFNADTYLEACIKSILNQQYRHFELIMIDGGSEDRSLTIIETYKTALSYWISEPDNGIYDAWNKGLRQAKGDWIVFVGADDVLLPNALQTYVDHIIAQPDHYSLEFVSALIDLVDDKLNTIRTVGAQWQWEKFRKEMITWHVGCFHAKCLFETYGIFDPSYKVSGDYELLLRPKERLRASFVSIVTAKMRTGGVSHKRLYQAIEETYRAKIKNGVISLSQGLVLTYVDKLRVYMRGLTGWKW